MGLKKNPHLLSLPSRLRIAAVYALSAVIVLSARLWSSLWGVIVFILLLLGLALLGVFDSASGLTHWSILIVSAVAGCMIAARTGAPFFWPSRTVIEHDMERASGIDHRPLLALRDRPVTQTSDPALWEAHQQRMGQMLGSLRPARFETSVPQRDRYRLRFIAPLVFACLLLLGREAAPERLSHFVSPGAFPWPSPAPITVDAWIEPPAYTQATPVHLTAPDAATRQTAATSVPAGSILKLRINGPRFFPTVLLNSNSGEMTRVGPRSYTFEHRLHEETALSLRYGLTALDHWQIDVTPDQPPYLSLIAAGAGDNGLLKLTWQAKDDYGLTTLTAHITVPDADKQRVGEDSTTTLNLSLPTRPSPGKTLDGVFSEQIDLSRHPLAGMPVSVVITATDDAGHQTTSAPLTVTLPERTFSSAAAARLVFERKRLFWFGDQWLSRDFSTATLLDIVNTPQTYRGDPVVFLALASALKRLTYDPRPEAAISVQELLWDIALRIEEGGVSESARDLQQALGAFSAALNNPETSQRELAQLLDAARQAMQAYMQAMDEELRQRQQMQNANAPLPPEIADKVMKKIDFDALMEHLRTLQNGESRQQLREMIDSLRTAVQGMSVEAMARARAQQQQAMQALSALSDIITKQQEIIEATQQAQEKEEWQDIAQEQSHLRTELGAAAPALAPLLGAAGADIDAALNLMGLATDRLHERSRDNALAAEQQALAALSKAQDNAMEQLARQMQQMFMLGMGGVKPGGGFGEGYDPLGRDVGDGKAVGGSIGLPSQGEQQRARTIQKELRDRSNDSRRPRKERDYLERLLDTFGFE